MLLKIEIENFYSIRERVRLDFRAANINTAKARELQCNVIDWNGCKVLKSLGLFGPNASGKSNILKAISACCQIILSSHLYNEGDRFSFQPFKFGEWHNKPSTFLVDFVCDDVEYEYGFTLTKDAILSESLYYYPNGRKAKVFVREGSEYSFGTALVKPNDVAINTGNKNLFLSRASSMNRDLPKKLYLYFFNYLLHNVDIKGDDILRLFNNNKQIILHALEICDYDITDISVKKELTTVPVPVPGGKGVQYQEMDIYRFFTTHRGVSDIKFDLDVEESDGTRKLFKILLLLLDVVKNGKSILFDEFDMGLHTRLADFVLDLVHASKKSQLLFSSHNTNLIDVDRLRRDQIVFVNKSADGATETYSLFDYKDFRENMDAQKGYIQGRFDAVPYIDSSVEKLKRFLEE